MLYVGLIPPWQHFDEADHFECVRFIVVERRLPNRPDANLAIRGEIVASMIEHDFGRYMQGWSVSSSSDPKVLGTTFADQPLYYVLCALLLYPIRYQNIVLQLHVLRSFSVLLNVGIVALAYLTARTLFPGDLLVQLGVPLFIVFLPAYTDIMSALNTDVLANFLFSLTVYLAVVIQRQGHSGLRLALLGGVLALGLLTKRTVIPALLIPLLLLLLAMERRYGWKVMAIAASVAGLLSAVAGRLFVANWKRLPTRFKWYLNMYPPDVLVSSVLDWRRWLPVYADEIEILAKGFWGNFAYGAYSLEGWWLVFPFLLSAVAGIGVLWTLTCRSKTERMPVWQRQTLLLLLLMTAVVWLSAFLRVHLPFSGSGIYIPRARYAYVAIIPMACLFVWGVRQFLRGQRGHLLGLAIVFGYVMLDSVAFFGHIIPAFFKVEDLYR